VVLVVPAVLVVLVVRAAPAALAAVAPHRVDLLPAKPYHG
jgi:hypothetical protein